MGNVLLFVISVACLSYANRLEDLIETIEQCLMIGEIGFDHYFVGGASAYATPKKYLRFTCYSRYSRGIVLNFYMAENYTCRNEAIMEMKKLLAGWSKVGPGCNIGRKYPDSFIGKKVRNHWEKGCNAYNAYIEVYGSEATSPKKDKEKPDKN